MHEQNDFVWWNIAYCICFMIVFFIIYRPYFHLQEKRTDVACLGLQHTRKYVMVSPSMLKVLHLGLQLNDWVDTTQCVRHYPPPLKILHFVCLYKSPKLFRFLPLECKDGYFGSKCEKLCRYPNYGKLCQFNCNCTDEDCDHISGCQGTKSRLFSGIFLLEYIYCKSGSAERFSRVLFSFA